MAKQKLTLTSKVRIYPKEEDRQKIIDTANAFRNAANYVSKVVLDRKITTSGAAQDITYDTLREDFRLRAQMACSVNRSVIAKYASMKSNGVKDTLAVFKKYEYDLQRDRDYSFKSNGKISMSTIYGRVEAPYNTKGVKHFFQDDSWRFGRAQLVIKKNKFYLHISATKEVEIPELDQIDNIVGIDLGINFIATYFDSNGKTHFISGKEIKQKRAKFKRLRRELQKRGTPSARRRLKAIGQRENRWMSDVNHRISKALVQQYGENTLFVLEDLSGIRGALTKVRRKNRYETVSWAYADLRDKLTYKAKMNGSKVVLVCPKYTSQDCPKCNTRDRKARNRRISLYSCKACGYQTNDDRVAAMNIYAKGVKLYLDKTNNKVPA